MDEIPQKQGASQDLCMFWSVSFADWAAKKDQRESKCWPENKASALL